MPAFAYFALRRELLMPLVHCSPSSVGVGTTMPPGHMQNE